ncbi:hypothetical protein NAT51_06710 [Flavobacterium amniphilum]|uniref:hypothetical protein n=1 Tax=Flavobacterium amniphilum TaxID=1834035 RepID=UPI00202A6355|nr:hypothetical protein [Flavobacterium amniphilum]MCL9805203.1 hypothetical protein [Flavobacterium amniphilum]
MTIFSKPVTLIFSSIAVVTTAVFSLCSDDGWGMYDWTSNFAPESYVDDKSYEQLFYSANMFYGDEWYDNAHSNRFGSSIVNDWKSYLGNKISDKDLNYYILNDSSTKDVKTITKLISTNKTDQKWSKKYDLKDDKTRKFFTFINLAKSLEPYTNNTANWNYNTDSMDAMNYMTVAEAKKIENIYNLAKDPFLKSRYWFLTMKAYFYSANKNEAVNFFNKTQATQERNDLYYRGVAYLAGVMYKKKDYARSNFMYSLVFDQCPKLRVVATYCFHPQEDKDFQQSLAMAKSNSQKASLWALYGYYADPTQAISKIYELDPKNKHLDYLLTRAINIEENKLNAIDWSYEYGNKPTMKNQVLDPKLYQLATTIANAKNTNSPYMWNTVAGYLEIIKGNHKGAESYLALAEKNIPNTILAKEQLRLFQLFNTIASVKKMDAASESKLLPELKWLFNAEKLRAEGSKLRANFLTAWSRNYIATLYKKQGNEVLAELFFREKEFYLNPERTEKMQNHLLKSNFTDWEKLAQSLYNVSLDDIYEFKAIKLAYKNQIQQAIAELEKSNKNKETVLYGNPFNGNIMDCNDCDHVAYQKTKFSKISFLKKVQEMQNSLASGNDKFNNAILLGNAFYNMSHYGNARLFYANKIINQYGYDIDKLYQDMLFSNKLSQDYYQKAFAAASNDEQKAKAVYLLTKIERNDFYLSSTYKPFEVDYIVFNGYKKLMKEYSKTKYYQEVIRECGYFRNVAGN